MKQNGLKWTLGIALTIGLAGCTGTELMPADATQAGAVTGAAVGAAVGYNTRGHHKGRRAVVGGLIGAAAGAAAGQMVDRSRSAPRNSSGWHQ